MSTNSKMPSIRTVAQRAGVSTATVSNVLNSRRSVAPELVARVNAAVAELGYIADMGAARLRSRRSTVIGALVPDIANPFFGTFVSVLETAARRDGYELLIASSNGDTDQEEARLRTLLTWRPAGLIVIPCADLPSGLDMARVRRVPVVVADRAPANGDVDAVAVDNAEASAVAVRHLVQAGRRHILVGASRLTISNVKERVRGARNAASDAGVTLEVLEVGLTMAEGLEALGPRLGAGPRPDALFTLNNVATLAALRCLSGAGLAVGRDVALVGFDDPDWMRSLSPPLTAVEQPLTEMAERALARLVKRIGGDDSPPNLIRLGCQLLVRASSDMTPIAVAAA